MNLRNTRLVTNKFSFIFLLSCFFPLVLFAQVASPDSEQVFREDDKNFKTAAQNRIKKSIERETSTTGDTFFNAPQIEFLRETNELVGSGGVVLSQGGIHMQADNGRYHSQKKTITLDGNVVVSGIEGGLSAKSGSFDLNTETGTFDDVFFILEENGYQVHSTQLNKISEDEYKLNDAKFSTCDCLDKSYPWSVNSNDVSITQEGYAVAKNVTLRCNDIPVLYAPYFFFPVMTKLHTQNFLRL